jgi:hypothetical protein
MSKHRQQNARRGRGRSWAVVAVLGLTLGVGGSSVSGRAAEPAARATQQAESAATGLLRTWGSRRALAFRRDQLPAIQALYVSTKVAREDVQVWRRYHQRALVLTELQFQVHYAQIVALTPPATYVVALTRTLPGALEGALRVGVPVPQFECREWHFVDQGGVPVVAAIRESHQCPRHL